MPQVTGLIIGGVVALLVLSLLIWRRRRRTKSLRAHAEVLLGWGDYEGAAKDLLTAGRWEEAAGLFCKAGKRFLAAELLLKHNRADEALDALAGASQAEVEQAEESLARTKALENPAAQKRLAEIARSAGAFEMSIRLYECLGDQREKHTAQLMAARSLASEGRHLEAAILYSELGEKREAAQARLDAARKEPSPENRVSLAKMAADEFTALGEINAAVDALLLADDLFSAVELLLSRGQEKRAAALCEQGGQWVQAAGLYEKLGDLESAARVQKKGGQLHKAAALLERSGDYASAARCMAEMHDMAGAGTILLHGGDVEGALQYFTIVDDKELPSAAETLAASGHLRQAVDLLVRRNHVRAAADLLNANGQQEWASELLAQLGDRFEKAKLLKARAQFKESASVLLELGKIQEAYSVLKEAPRLDTASKSLLAKIALQLEHPDEAISIYSGLLESGDAGADRSEILYGLSRAFESSGKVFEASAALQELLSIDPNHRDAALRLRLLQGRFTPQPFAVSNAGQSAGEGQGANDSGIAGIPARYRVTAELGRGSMGVVYRAIDQQLSRPVAIKVLEQQAGGNVRIREYFLREARAVAQLNHPNIVTVYDAGLQGTTPWLAMELVEGDDLRTRFQQGRPSLMQAMRIGAQVASALDCAHARGIVHRDLKPENIMVANDGSAKLMDFGIAYVMQEGGKGESRKNTVVGTPVYMAPEQIKGEQIDGRTDIYALGVVLFECFCGRLPFDPDAAMFHNVNTPPPDPLLYRPELAPELAELVLKCLEKSPENRPQKASEIQRTLMKIGSRIASGTKGGRIPSAP